MAATKTTVWGFLMKLFRSSIHQTTLLDLANRYEQELIPYEYVYTFKQKGKRAAEAVLSFEKGNFCHLFSIGSMVKGLTPDVDQFAGTKGWNNIKNGRITYPMLKQINPSQFEYYHKEQTMLDEFIDTLEHPKAVVYDKSRVKNSNLDADVLLYGIYGQDVVHLALSQDKYGSWFCRSYFVRDINKDKLYPTKYIANQAELDVKVKKRRA